MSLLFLCKEFFLFILNTTPYFRFVFCFLQLFFSHKMTSSGASSSTAVPPLPQTSTKFFVQRGGAPLNPPDSESQTEVEYQVVTLTLKEFKGKCLDHLMKKKRLDLSTSAYRHGNKVSARTIIVFLVEILQNRNRQIE